MPFLKSAARCICVPVPLGSRACALLSQGRSINGGHRMLPAYRLARSSLIPAAIGLGLPSCALVGDGSSTDAVSEAVVGAPAFVQQHYATPQTNQSSVSVAYS